MNTKVFWFHTLYSISSLITQKVSSLHLNNRKYYKIKPLKIVLIHVNVTLSSISINILEWRRFFVNTKNEKNKKFSFWLYFDLLIVFVLLFTCDGDNLLLYIKGTEHETWITLRVTQKDPNAIKTFILMFILYSRPF